MGDNGTLTVGGGNGWGASLNGGLNVNVVSAGNLKVTAPIFSSTTTCAAFGLGGCISFNTLQGGRVISIDALVGPGIGASLTSTLNHSVKLP